MSSTCTPPPSEDCVPPPSDSAQERYQTVRGLLQLPDFEERTLLPSSKLHPLSLSRFAKRNARQRRGASVVHLARNQIDISSRRRIESFAAKAGLGGEGRCERSVQRRRQWLKPGESRRHSVCNRHLHGSVREIHRRFRFPPLCSKYTVSGAQRSRLETMNGACPRSRTELFFYPLLCVDAQGLRLLQPACAR